MIRYEKKGNISYALGLTLCFELLNYKKEAAKRLYIHPKMLRDDTYHKLVSLAHSLPIPVIENNEKIFNALSEKENVMAIAEFEKFEDTLPKGNHLLLSNPMNQGNLGTIVRGAAAFSIDGLAILRPAADIFDPKVVRSSMGALFRLPFHYYRSYEEYAKDFPENHPYPFMLQAKTFLQETKIERPYTLLFGNEAKGLPESFLEVGTPIKIEQSSSVDSLNLDNAVSIGLYHFSQHAK